MQMSQINIHSGDGVSTTLYSSDEEWDVLNRTDIDIEGRFDIMMALSDGYAQVSSIEEPVTSYFNERVAASVSPSALDALRRVIPTTVDRSVAIEVIKFMRLRETKNSLHTHGTVNRHGVMVGTEEQYASKRWTILPAIKRELHIWLATRFIEREAHDGAEHVHPGVHMYTWDEHAVELLFIMLHAKRARSRAGQFGAAFSENCKSDVIISVVEKDDSPDSTELFFGNVEYGHSRAAAVHHNVVTDPAADWGIAPKEKRRGTRGRRGRKGQKSGNRKKKHAAEEGNDGGGGSDESDDEKPHAEDEGEMKMDASTEPVLCQICYEYIPTPEVAPKECACNLFAHVECITTWNTERERAGLSRKACMVC